MFWFTPLILELIFFGKNLIFLKVGLVFFVSSKENVFSNMDTLYLRENDNQGHMKNTFLGGHLLDKVQKQ